MTSQNPIVTFTDVSKRYGETVVLEDVNLAVAPGDFMVLLGPPAGGKSVLLRLLMGLEEPSSGRITLRGEDVTGLPAADRNIGYVPQSFALYPHFSVHDNIAYPLKLAGVSKRDSEPAVRHAAEMLKITDLLDKRPDQLSGGQKQRVAIARGIAKQTELYVLDDPLAGLDFKLREQLVEDLRLLQQEWNATFLYTTSDAIEALTLGDHLAVLDGGMVVDAGEPERLYRDPAHARAMALVGFPPANFLSATLEERDGRTWCRTPLFAFPAAVAANGGTPSLVTVGLRPEDLVIEGAASDRVASNGHGPGWHQLEARVVLREDLGGEEIIYLDCGGTSLTGVDRHHERATALRERATVALRGRDLLLFDPRSGERVGRGADGPMDNGR